MIVISEWRPRIPEEESAPGFWDVTFHLQYHFWRIAKKPGMPHTESGRYCMCIRISCFVFCMPIANAMKVIFFLIIFVIWDEESRKSR